jgi:hypothetical protein
MDRREFLQGFGKTLLVLPWGTFLLHCGGDDTTAAPSSTVVTNPTAPDPTPPDAAPQVIGPNVVYTTNQVELHSHSFTVPVAEFTTPIGMNGTTTVAQAHTHDVTFTVEDFTRAAQGQTVKVSTTSTLGHSHVFTLVRV